MKSFLNNHYKIVAIVIFLTGALLLVIVVNLQNPNSYIRRVMFQESMQDVVVDSHAISADYLEFSNYVSDHLPDGVELSVAFYDSNEEPCVSRIVFTNVDSLDTALSVLKIVEDYNRVANNVMSDRNYKIEMWTGYRPDGVSFIFCNTVNSSGIGTRHIEINGSIVTELTIEQYPFEYVDTVTISGLDSLDEEHTTYFEHIFPNSLISFV